MTVTESGTQHASEKRFMASIIEGSIPRGPIDDGMVELICFADPQDSASKCAAAPTSTKTYAAPMTLSNADIWHRIGEATPPVLLPE